jgi:hypothetical protein
VSLEELLKLTPRLLFFLPHPFIIRCLTCQLSISSFRLHIPCRPEEEGHDTAEEEVDGRDRVTKSTAYSVTSSPQSSEEGHFEPRTPITNSVMLHVDPEAQKAMSSEKPFDSLHDGDMEAKVSGPETKGRTFVAPVTD